MQDKRFGNLYYMNVMNTSRIPLILLASQSQQLAYLIQRYAENCGCRFSQTGCDENFKNVVLLDPPDVILLDISRTNSEGRPALQQLRSKEQTRLIPVILCATSELDWLDCEADGRLLQPVLFEQFAGAIKEIGINISENKKEA